MKHYLCMDETGRFEHSAFVKAPSAVGGYLIPQAGFSRLRGLLTKTLNDHNGRCAADEKWKDIPRLQEKDLHFRVLAMGHDYYDRENQFRYPEELGKLFIKSMIDAVNTEAMYFCRSSGRPPLNLHPQHSYTICLISLIAGIIEHQKSILGNGSELVLRIASRSRDVLTGEAARNIDKYHEIFRDEILDSLNKARLDSDLKVSIEIGSARRDADLVFADFALGAMTHQDFRDGIPDDRKILVKVRDYYHISLGGSTGRILEDIRESGAIDDAMLLALDFARSSEPGTRNDGSGYFNKYFKSLMENNAKAQSFVNLFGTRMEDLAGQRYEDPDALQALHDMCRMVLDLPRKHNTVQGDLLTEQALHYLVHWEAHSGAAPDDTGSSCTRRYEEFFAEKGTSLYPSLPARLERMLETKLIAIQALYFNAFLFEELCGSLEEDILTYEEAFRSYHGKEHVDDLYARLCGTYGQALAFAASIDGDRKKLETAREYLTLDLEYIPPGSPFLGQGASFLASACWCLDDAEGMRRAIAEGLGCPGDDASITGAVHSLDIRKGNNSFVYLDWIRLAELTGRMAVDNGNNAGQLLKMIDSSMKDIGEMKETYPCNLFAKWAAVLHCRSGNGPRALEILGTPGELPDRGSIFDVMAPLVNGLLVRAISGTGPADDHYIKIISRLGERYPGFKRFAAKRGLDRSIPSSVEEIARIMPYYYA